jgi:hypothetical protein
MVRLAYGNGRAESQALACPTLFETRVAFKKRFEECSKLKPIATD